MMPFSRLARRVRARPLAALEALAWIALLAFVGTRLWPQVAAAVGVASTRVTAPDFRLTTLDGRTVSRDALRGRVVLVNFWATWCPPCRIEMPGFQDVHDRYAAQGFTVVGVSTDARGADHVARFLAEHEITYPIAMASREVVRAFGGAQALPTSFLLDREGRIRHEVRGYFAETALDQAVRRLLAEPWQSGRPEQGAPSDVSTRASD